MPEPLIDALALTQAFNGNASATARSLGLPRKVVIKAVQCVVAERDWLLSLWEADAISRSQCERLAVLLGLLPAEVMGRPLRAEDVRTVAQTLPGPVDLQAACSSHSCAAETKAQVVIDLLPDGRVRMTGTRLGQFNAAYAPFPDEKLGQEVVKLVAELRSNAHA